MPSIQGVPVSPVWSPTSTSTVVSIPGVSVFVSVLVSVLVSVTSLPVSLFGVSSLVLRKRLQPVTSVASVKLAAHTRNSTVLRLIET